ncbi:MAG: helix-turn-helix transcriptional regulator [Marinobacter sp.]|jgi:DNA-binding XRE family transcriptional regulator
MDVVIDGVRYVPEANQAGEVSGLVLADRLKCARKNAGLTLQGLADLVGTSKSHIWTIEQGNTSPGFSMVCKICRATGANLMAIAGESEK